MVGAYAVAIPVTEESSIEAIKLCLERGVDINAFNTNGTTAVHSAVQRGAQGSYVFVVKPDQTVTMRNITTGVTERNNVEVTSGVTN